MHILVTGGSGFIGSFLVEQLVRHNHVVRIVDIAEPSNIVDGVEYYKVDVCSWFDLCSSFHGIDCVIHLAARSKIKDCIANPDLAFKTNVGGMLNVLLAAKSCGVRRVVFASSSFVYGDQSSLPFKEDMPVKLLNPYAITKFEGEHILCEFARWCGLQTVSLRLFNVYGFDAELPGRTDFPNVVDLFLHRRRLGQKLTIIGDGLQKRDFVHISDVATAFEAATTNESVGKGEIINIGSGDSHSILEIASWVGGEIENIDSRYGEAWETLADISRAMNLLKWEPKQGLKEWIESKKK